MVERKEEEAGEDSLRGHGSGDDRSIRNIDAKWIVRKRTKSGIYITIASGNTRKEIIDKTIADSETFSRQREEHSDGKEVH